MDTEEEQENLPLFFLRDFAVRMPWWFATEINGPTIHRKDAKGAKKTQSVVLRSCPCFPPCPPWFMFDFRFR